LGNKKGGAQPERVMAQKTGEMSNISRMTICGVHSRVSLLKNTNSIQDVVSKSDLSISCPSKFFSKSNKYGGAQPERMTSQKTGEMAKISSMTICGVI